jgi:hypothetical protein
MISKTLVKGKRIPTGIELIYILSFLAIGILALFPTIITSIEKILVINVINTLLIVAVFVSYLIHFKLYEKTERQREELTKLARQIALTNEKK